MDKKKETFFFAGANRVRIGYTLAFLMLLLSLGLTLLSVEKLLGRAKEVERTNEIILNLEGFLGSVKDGETGFRGYLAMADPAFLVPYIGSKNKADSILITIKGLVAGNIVQLKYANVIGALTERRYQIFEQGLDIFRKGAYKMSDSLNTVFKNGKIGMDSIRLIIKTMQQHEQGLLMRNTERLDSIRTAVHIINLASLAVSVLLAFYSFFTFNKENKARQSANDKADDYRKRLEERIADLRIANAELVLLRQNEKFAVTGRLARTIAHEVRNPLTNINLAVEQIREETGLPDTDPTPLLDMIDRNSSRVNQLVTDLLDSTRFSELRTERKAINDLLEDTLELAADRIGLNQVAVVKDYSENICEVEVDTEKIKIAFLNIIVNAIEAMEPGKGVLTLRTAGETDQCMVYIIDNGIGMDQEAVQRLFEPYFTSKTKGNGLGMTNTQKIILNHNGSIRVESTPGQGTSFVIALRFPV
ncbi:MAG: ATP-binding protein [Bacteroidota bacterium]